MKNKYVSVCLIGFAVMAIVLMVHDYKQAGVNASAAAVDVVQPNVDSQLSTVGGIRNLRFTLFDAGIRPSEMRIKAGLVNILIEDKTNLSQGVTVRHLLGFDRVVVGVIEKQTNQLRGRNSVRLTGGEYELYDVSKPANKAVLHVDP